MIWADIRQGKFEKAFNSAEKLYSLYPENTASYSLMVESLTNLKKYNEAEEYYIIWKKISNDCGEDALFSRHRIANLLWMNGKKEKAIELFHKHIEVCESSKRVGGLCG
jgi:tetratricopeptide (TPR) repeat protein